MAKNAILMPSLSDIAARDATALARLDMLVMHELTVYDAAEEVEERKRKHLRVNIYRLGILLGRWAEVMESLRGGAPPSLARALYDNFNDRLLTRLEKACGLAVTYGGGSRSTGRPA